MSSKTILFILPVFKEGGAEKTLSTIMEGLASRGFDVTLIIIKNSISFPFPSNVRTDILEKGWMGWVPEFVKKACFRRKIIAIVRDEQPEAVLASLPYAHKIVSRAQLPVDKCFFTVHNTPSSYFSENPSKKERDLKKLKSIYDGQNIVTISEGVKEDMLAVGVRPKSIVTIYNPFDLQAIRKRADEGATEIPDEPYLVYPAHFYARKRHDILIEAFAKADVKEKLVFLGSRGEVDEVKKLVEKKGLQARILFAGWHANPYPWIKRAKLLVFASEQEGLGRVLIESLALGTPVVSTDCPSGPSEILTGALARFLVPVNDPTALSRKIREALEEYPEIVSVYTDKFEKEHVIDRYVKLLTEGRV